MREALIQNGLADRPDGSAVALGRTGVPAQRLRPDHDATALVFMPRTRAWFRAWLGALSSEGGERVQATVPAIGIGAHPVTSALYQRFVRASTVHHGRWLTVGALAVEPDDAVCFTFTAMD